MGNCKLTEDRHKLYNVDNAVRDFFKELKSKLFTKLVCCQICLEEIPTLHPLST